jgi:Ca-activated chloride channel family protein
MPRFADWPALLLLLGLPALLYLYIRRQRAAGAPAWRFSSLRLTAGAPPALRERARHLPAILRLSALVLIILALARPQTGQTREVVRGDGIDIMLVLDMSGSMSAEDFQPKNRLTVAKEVVKEFVRGRQYDRIGLVVFARQSYLQCPLTLDYDVLSRLVDQIELAPDMGLDDGTAIGVALATALNHLKDSAAKSKIIVLLTDGNNNAGPIDPVTAAQAAHALGVKVYTIGVGQPGAAALRDPILGVQAELDEETLKKVAQAGDAQYFLATDADALRAIYRKISQMEQTSVEVKRYTRYTEWAHVLILPAVVLLGLELILRHTWLRTLP